MKKISGTICFVVLLFINIEKTEAQNIKDIFNNVLSNVQSATSKTGTSNFSKITNTDAIAALREALQVSAQNASGKLSATNGFFGNSLVKILLPPEAAKVETTLRTLGMGKLADNTILNMNRAAENAASQATPIFINAIKNISIQDGLSLLQGGNGAATNFLRTKTTADLTAAFRPVIEKSLNQYNVANLWNQLFNTYNKLPTVKNPINPDLVGYVTQRALNGLFQTIAVEENKIRTDPAARISTLLQKVFGAK